MLVVLKWQNWACNLQINSTSFFLNVLIHVERLSDIKYNWFAP